MGSNSGAGDKDCRGTRVAGAGDRLWLGSSLAVLAATLVWFFFYADPGSKSPRVASQELATGAEGQSPAVGEAGVAESAVAPHFLVGERCGLCHADSTRARAMRDSGGQSVAPFDLWSTSMMAQSARDPYWRAVLSAEVAVNPGQKAHLEEVRTPIRSRCRCNVTSVTRRPTVPTSISRRCVRLATRSSRRPSRRTGP